ncbi:MAG: hypothetical protein IPN69_19585 [Acidobacteria bacterium]|nr:hypothetical protein [Acidobacteriota bacterium]MBK8812913.1 hypothetical protein [Acidobacteriota bacterium]
MFLRLTVLILVFSMAFAVAVAAQEAKTDKTAKSDNKQTAPEAATAEQVAESAIFIYGGLLGRQNLDQIRKTSFERGKTTVTEADGRKTTSTYERFIVRGENQTKEKIRFDQAYPDAKFSLVYNNEKIYGLYNETVFTPREDATRAFQNQIWHSIDALLRYKENESKLELVKREKIMGVDFYLVDVTDKQNLKTRFYVSVKSLRVMMLEYESESVKFKRKFYDYNYAQGTLVPYRSVLWANEREVEETEIGTVTFGQKIGETLFQES